MEKSSLVKTGAEAAKAILRGVNAIYDPVRMTLGPEGKNALLYRTFNRGSRITNDGVTIAQCIEPDDEFENLAAKAFKEAAIKTNQRAGDGTTTACVIGGHLVNKIFSKIINEATEIKSQTAGGDEGVMQMRAELLRGKDLVLNSIKTKAKKIETIDELERIGTVSTENEEIGKLVAKISWEIGPDGFVDITDGHKGEIETDIIKGMRFPAKPGAKAFVNNPAKFEMFMDDIDCVVTNYSIDNAAQIAAFTNFLKTSKLAIFAPSFSENVLMNLVNAFKKGFHVFPIAVPSLRTEQLEDLSVYLGAEFINKDKNKKIENIRKEHLGFAHKIVVKDTDARDDASVIGGRGSAPHEIMVGGDRTDVYQTTSDVAARIEILRKQIPETNVELHRKLLEKRIAAMSAAVGVIRVGAPSEAEALYKKLKIEDGVSACKAALQEGYVRGGGLCLKDIAEELPESILTDSLTAPYRQILENAEGKIEISDDIIDPAKVVRLSVEHAISVAAHLITTRIIVSEARDRDSYAGSKLIADATNLKTKLWARKEGIIKENEVEVEHDRLQLLEEKQFNDFG